jgi:glyoxylase-like metal-dependent hydrolase (beta-lactamase superfamily II)
MYRIDVLVQGFPGKAVCHGGLGWSSIALLRGGGRTVLVDVGSFGMRRVLIPRLAELGVTQDAVTDVVLTHSHYDHSVNWTLFPGARICIGGAELDWSLTVAPGPHPVPELYMRELARSPQLHRLLPGEELLPGLVAHAVPGHTPGHLAFLLRGVDRDLLFSGDAAKNRAELLTGRADMSLDEGDSRRSIAHIWELWRRRPGTLLVPGHDVPMLLEGGKPVYIGEREAAIAAWLDEDLEQTKIFRLG